MQVASEMKATRFTITLGAANVVLAVLVTGVALMLGHAERLLGAALGGFLATANLVAVSHLCYKLVSAERRRWPYAAALAGKFLLLVALIFAIVSFLRIDVVWFVVGLSTGVVALLAVGLTFTVSGMELRLK